MTSPADIPGYLGRLVDASGAAVGSCFQVRPGVLVTAWHVLDDLRAGEVGAEVRIGPLGATPSAPATVCAVDELRDLAVLTCGQPFDASVPGLVASDSVAPTTAVQVTGVSNFINAKAFRFSSTTGTWQGPAVRDDQVPLGVIEAANLVKGMSGAPVRRVADDRVVGVVSARYNSGPSSAYLQHAVWVARTEDLGRLLAGVAEVAVADARPAGAPLDLVLSVSERTVRLSGAGVDVSAGHDGIRSALSYAVRDALRERARPARLEVRADDAPGAATVAVGNVSLRRAGELVEESFLTGPVRDALAQVLRRARRETAPVRLAIDAPDHRHLPWEAVPDPVTRAPLALHPLVSVYRRGEAGAPIVRPGPLRIVVAIASPEVGGGPLLDYEHELSVVLDAVRAARQDAAQVTVVPFATTAAIRAALDGTGVHVLHVSAHGAPGRLVLEDDDGGARLVTADEFVKAAVPPGGMPPVIALAACHTDVAAQEQGGSFAAGLAAAGACAVIGTQTSVTDQYATKLFARVYAHLSAAPRADVIRAVAEARRAVQDELTRSQQPIDRLLSGLDEWSVVTVLAGQPQVAVVGGTMAAPVDVPTPVDVGGLLARPPGQFVGRRGEQRRLPALLESDDSCGLVLHGIGGVGKTTLAAELLRRVLDRDRHRRVITCTGPLTVDGIFTAVAAVLRPELLRRGVFDGPQATAVRIIQRMDVPWQDRFTLLHDDLLTRIPTLLVLDNFEDNLARDGEGWTVPDQAVAELLAAWTAGPARSRIVVTSRYRFALPDAADARLHWHHLTPMSQAETRKLMWSLPSLERHAVDPDDAERIWRGLGGHPRTLEYLDALLANGQGRFADITDRLTAAAEHRLGAEDARQWLARPRTLDAALAEVVTLAADDVLLTEHLAHLDGTPDAVRLLAAISVYRRPVDGNALLFHLGQPDDTAGFMPDHKGIAEQISDLLGRHGLGPGDLDRAFGDDSPVTDVERRRLHGLLSDYQATPRPPLRAPAHLDTLLRVVADTSLVSIAPGGLVVMHRWTATELHDRWRHGGRVNLVEQAHRRAADYWQWRVVVWPQTPVSDVEDLDEARHHLLAAGDTETAGTLSEYMCSQLDQWGAWDRESSLIHDTLRHLAADSPRRPAWYHQLGILARRRGDLPEAERRYRQSLTINEQLGDQAGIATNHHQLGTLAHNRGDHSEAEHRYQQSLTIDEHLGNQAGIAASHHQLGILAHDRGDYSEAEHRYQQSLTINERLGNQAGIAASHHELGMLAHDRGDYSEAEHRYQQSLTIKERLGDQAGIAASHHQLGMLAHDRGDHSEAEHRYQQSLTIEEQLGNQVGIASSYGQLGILAHDRGDHSEAEHRYQQSLTINEQLGNQVGIATCCSRIANLYAETHREREAVSLHCRALAIRLAVGLPQAHHSIDRLRELRETLGPDAFAAAVAAAMNAESVANLNALIDQPEEPPSDGDE